MNPDRKFCAADYTILIVDDDEDFRFLIGLDFQKAGFRLLFAESGNRAFEMILSESIDLLITDVVMPDGDGISLIARVRARSRHQPPIIVVTGYSDLAEHRFFEMGALAYFAKPFDRSELMESVRKILSSVCEPHHADCQSVRTETITSTTPN